MKNPKLHLINCVLERHKSRRKFFVPPQQAANKDLNECTDALEKGTAFETFVVRHFNPDYFTLIEWRSDKHTDGIFPLMCKFPDLEFYFQSHTNFAMFAVECKWLNNFYKEGIKLNNFQLDNYRHYEAEMEMPTFIVIGVGNTPSAPQHVYVLPLRDIKNEYLHEFELNVYRKPTETGFFLDCKRMILRQAHTLLLRANEGAAFMNFTLTTASNNSTSQSHDPPSASPRGHLQNFSY